MPGTKVLGCILDSIWSDGQDGGGSTKDHCSSVFTTKYIEGMPRCALHRLRGHAQDPGTCGQTICETYTDLDACLRSRVGRLDDILGSRSARRTLRAAQMDGNGRFAR